MGGREFLTLTSDDLKRYREEYIKLPPRKDFLKRIEDAIRHEIPFEYLVDAGVINVNILKQLDITEDDFNYIKEYMIFKGYKDALKLKWKRVVREKKDFTSSISGEDVNFDSTGNKEMSEVSEEELTALKSKVTLLELELGKNKEMLDDVSNKLNKTNRQLNRERDEKTKYKIEVEKKELLLQTAKENLRKLEAENKETEEELYRLRVEVEDLYVENSKKDLSIERLESKLKEKEALVDEILAEAKDLKEDIFRLTLDIKNKDSIIDELEKTNEELNEKINKLSVEIRDKELNIKSLQGSVNEILKDNKTSLNESELISVDNALIVIENQRQEIEELKKSIELSEQEYKEKIAALERENGIKLEKLIEEQERDIEKLYKTFSGVRTKTGDKVVSLLGRYSYFIEENLKLDGIVFDVGGLVADLYIITTDISASSVKRFKETLNNLKDENVIKIMFMWDKNDPFTPESVVGSSLDVVIEKNKDMYKSSWVGRDNSWVKRIEEVILGRLQ